MEGGRKRPSLGVATLTSLKNTAARARSRIVAKREGQGRTNERTGPAPASAGGVPPLPELQQPKPPSRARSFSASLRGSFRSLWPKSGKSGRNSSESKYTSELDAAPTLASASSDGRMPIPTMPRLSMENQRLALAASQASSENPRPAAAAASNGSVSSSTAAPLASSAQTASAASPGTPRYDNGVLPGQSAPTVAPARAMSSPATSSPGTPRPGHQGEEASSSPLDAATAKKAAEDHLSPPPIPPESPAPAAGDGPVASPEEISLEGIGSPSFEGDFADEDLAETGLPEAQLKVIEQHVAAYRADLSTLLAIEAAKWLISQSLLPADVPALQLDNCISAALNMKSAELAHGRPKPPAFGAATPEDDSTCQTCWQQRMSAMIDELRSPSQAAAAQERAQPWAKAVLEVKTEVIDPNHARLSEHLENMWTEHVNSAKSDLTGSRLRTVMKAKALRVHQTLKGAMDDVEMQFRNGMTPLAMAKPELNTSGLAEEHVKALCSAAIKYYREVFDRPWQVAALEKELDSCMAKEEQLPTTRATMGLGEDPFGWLLGLVLGSADLPLPLEARDFLCTATADYLDPFIDGEVAASEYERRSEGLFMDRLRRAWSERCTLDEKPQCDMPVTPVCALAQYCTHSITKMNYAMGFGPHMPGVGRQPCMERECQYHFERLATSLLAAIENDFGEAERSLGSLTQLTAGHIKRIAAIHLRGCVTYQQELGNALAIANRDGEEARREERKRIWGYAAGAM